MSEKSYRYPIFKIATSVLCAMLTGCDGSQSGNLAPNDQVEAVTLVNNGPAGNSGLTAEAIRYPLNVGLADQWGPENDHYRLDFTLSNGNFRVELAVINGVEHSLLVPAQTTVVFHAKMFSPGDNFDLGSFAYAASVTGSSLSGVAYFTDSYVGLDTNFDDRVDTDEQVSVVDGLVQLTGVLPDIALEFSVTLSNGQLVTGHYSGLYDFTQRF